MRPCQTWLTGLGLGEGVLVPVRRAGRGQGAEAAAADGPAGVRARGAGSRLPRYWPVIGPSDGNTEL